MTNLKFHTSRNLIDSALAHLALERAAGCVIQVPDTEPPLFVAVGPAPAIARLLQDELPARAMSALADVQFDESEGGHHD